MNEIISVIMASCLIGLFIASGFPFNIMEEPFDFKEKVYKFSDDSICPCQSGRMFFSEECNNEINEKLSLGYKEVQFVECEQKQ